MTCAQGSKGRDVSISVIRSLEVDVTRLRRDFVTECVRGEFLCLGVRGLTWVVGYFKDSRVELYYFLKRHFADFTHEVLFNRSV